MKRIEMPKYSDLSLNSSIKPLDENAVIAAVRNILFIRIGERFFNRSFGSEIENLLFEPISFVTSRFILSEIVSSISKWDSRVEVMPESTVVADALNRRYNVTLYLQIKGLSKQISYSEVLIQKDTGN
jgi:phage baseplate assembly protein W